MNNPEIIEELQRIADEHAGLLHASDVVEAARPKDSILHSRFEWDNRAAGEAYRLVQARQLIRVSVTYVGAGLKTARSRIFVSLTPDRQLDKGGYRNMTVVMRSPSQRSQLLEDALIEMNRFQQKYQQLTELAEVFTSMRRVQSEVEESRTVSTPPI